MKKVSKKLPNKLLSTLFLAGFRWYLGTFFSLQLERDNTKGIVPPYLLIANHSNFWDGVLVNLFIRDPICFLVADEYFRKPLLGWLLRLEGSIRKKKFSADFLAIKEALKAKKEGRIIGIFPEGKRNWDGSTEEILYPTAKLIKMLDIPVVRALLKGSYLTFPRWARYKRKGKISFYYDLILTPEKIRQLSVEEIYQKIKDSLTYQEYEFQRRAMNVYQGKDLAEKLELYLFLCPHCLQIGSLFSRSDILACRNCGYQVRYNQYGFLEPEEKLCYYDNPADWNQWQVKFIHDSLQEISNKGNKTILLQDEGVSVIRIERDRTISLEKECWLFLQGKVLSIERDTRNIFDFAIDLIRGINVQYNNQLEFYFQDQLYRFRFDHPSVSAYKWYRIIKLAQNLVGNTT